MAPIASTYHEAGYTPAQARLGGPRRRQPASRFEQAQRYGLGANSGSHMPLDTDIHWTWRNPLNIIPALMVVVVALALIALIF